MFRKRQQVLEKDQAHVTGSYLCTCCHHPLFEASKKFEVGSGFPSFWAQMGDHVTKKALTSYGRERTQVLCSKCGQHLGHLFQDARTPTQLRYCINQAVICFAK